MKGRQFWITAAAGLSAAAIAIGGCGGNDGSSDNAETTSATSTTSAPLTKAAFVKQANLICQRGLEEKDDAVRAATEELPAKAQANPSPQEIEQLVKESVLPTYEKLVEQLSELDAPTAEEHKTGKIVEQFENALKVVEAQPVAAVEENPFEEADKAADAYGLEICTL